MTVTVEELAQQRARLALADMAKHRVPITPANYTLWYDHVVRTNQELSAALEALLARGRTLTEESLTELYQRFFAPPATPPDEPAQAEDELRAQQDTVDRISGALRTLVSGMHEQLGGAGHDLGQYCESLSGFVDKTEGSPDVAEVLRLVDDLVTRTRAMKTQTDSLRANLEAQAQEVLRLEHALAASQSAASTDHLTRLPNRLVFESTLAKMAEDALEGSHAPALLIVDIDHFKSVNDTHGHLVGDLALQHVAKVLKENVRGGDLVSRWGGEEFSILLPNTPRSGALVVAEAIRSALEAQPVLDDQGVALIERLTASIGVSWLRADEPFETFIERADRALYQAKEGGRNRVMDENRQPR